MKSKLIQYPIDQWASLSANYLQALITENAANNDRYRVMLTGGRSAERVMLAWSELPDFTELKNVDFFFGDERCVPPEHSASNYGLAMRTLFRFGIPEGCVVHRMKACSSDKMSEAKRYSELLSDRVDLLLLSVGEDGHIASLFPGSPALHDTRKVVPVTGPKSPADRFTITPSVISNAKSIVNLATGKEKIHPVRESLLSSGSEELLPARLVRHATWLVDFDVPVFESL